MTAATRAQVRALKTKKISELKAQYLEVFGEAPRSNNRIFLQKRIAWRIQAMEEGGISERARKRALALANDADLRFQAPRRTKESPLDPMAEDGCFVTSPHSPGRDPRLPIPGTLLFRQYKGKDIVVKVLDEGFEFGGKKYRSLSAIATAVTGKKWNGFAFFNIAGNPKEASHA